MDCLRNDSLTCVIRKRLPFRDKVEAVYFHAKSPASSLFGRAKVTGIENVPVADAAARKTDLRMTELEIMAYTKGLSQIGIMEFRQFEPTRDLVEMQSLRDTLDYFPPQSFSFISRRSLPIINDLCGF